MRSIAYQYNKTHLRVGLLIFILITPLVTQPCVETVQPQQGGYMELSTTPRATAYLQSRTSLVSDVINGKQEALTTRQVQLPVQIPLQLAIGHPLLWAVPLAFFMRFFLLPVFNSKYK